VRTWRWQTAKQNNRRSCLAGCKMIVTSAAAVAGAALLWETKKLTRPKRARAIQDPSRTSSPSWSRASSPGRQMTSPVKYAETTRTKEAVASCCNVREKTPLTTTVNTVTGPRVIRIDGETNATKRAAAKATTHLAQLNALRYGALAF